MFIALVMTIFIGWLLWALLGPSLRVTWSYRREIVHHFTRR